MKYSIAALSLLAFAYCNAIPLDGLTPVVVNASYEEPKPQESTGLILMTWILQIFMPFTPGQQNQTIFSPATTQHFKLLLEDLKNDFSRNPEASDFVEKYNIPGEINTKMENLNLLSRAKRELQQLPPNLTPENAKIVKEEMEKLEKLKEDANELAVEAMNIITEAFKTTILADFKKEIYQDNPEKLAQIEAETQQTCAELESRGLELLKESNLIENQMIECYQKIKVASDPANNQQGYENYA